MLIVVLLKILMKEHVISNLLHSKINILTFVRFLKENVQISTQLTLNKI